MSQSLLVNGDGNLTEDPVAQVLGGTEMVKGRLASNSGYMQNGAWVSTPTYIDFELWGRKGVTGDKRVAAFVSKFKKGHTIVISGELKDASYANSAGQNVHKNVIKVGSWSGPYQAVKTHGQAAQTAAPAQPVQAAAPAPPPGMQAAPVAPAAPVAAPVPPPAPVAPVAPVAPPVMPPQV